MSSQAVGQTMQVLDVIVRPTERGIAQSATAQMGVWAEAFEVWLGRLSANTARAYRKGWDDLLAFTSKQPWAMGKADVQRWADDMRLRGLSDCTRAQRIAGVSSFYEFATGDYTVILPDGREQALHSGNPASGKRLRPKVNPYGKASYLGKDSVRALLKAIKRNTVQGLRDYALFFGYLMTCRRNSEWRMLRWGDIEMNAEKIFYRWSGKGKKDQKFEMPEPVFQAMKAYLVAAGRWGKMAEGDFIFTALTDKATRLPGVATNFNPLAQAISMREVGRLLKVYG